LGQVTVVTGGSRGIGAATAFRLAVAGHDLAISYLSEAAAAERVAWAVEKTGRRCLTVQADVAVEADVERLFDRVAAELGPVTGLVNNAGITTPAGRFVDLTTADLRRVVDVNLIGSVLCARRAAREMATSRGGGGGAIVNVSSGAATLGSPGEYVHYAAAKAAVDTLTIGLAQELAPEGIRVNAVAPGLVRTEIHARGARDPERVERNAPRIPLGRPGEPDEIAAPIVWLLSPDASYTTGAILRVSGGR
jgi:NAD(P)-dependent dehydrogenase (short-subunit alcohol dehydrogenase family)